MSQPHVEGTRTRLHPGLPGYRRPAPGSQPKRLYEPYRSTILRAPRQTLIKLPRTLSELTGPLYGHNPIGAADNDLTRQCSGEPVGERIIVSGRIIDEDQRPIPNALVEIWQANSAGRYLHSKDEHPAPLDPNFIGAGRTISDKSGRYQFVTIMPGAYPWSNHDNAWRPRHIHFSLFGPAFVTRLITQMYFPGDPLIPHDPILQSIPDEGARQRMVSRFNFDLTKPGWAIGYEFDIVLRGRLSTPFEEKR